MRLSVRKKNTKTLKFFADTIEQIRGNALEAWLECGKPFDEQVCFRIAKDAFGFVVILTRDSQYAILEVHWIDPNPSIPLFQAIIKPEGIHGPHPD